MQTVELPAALQERIQHRAMDLRREAGQAICAQTDRVFALLIGLEWIAGILVALFISPLAWRGMSSSIHPHIWGAVFLGGLIAALPIALALRQPGRPLTRYVIACAQMFCSSLLIHLSGGRIETHFHIFGSLAFLSFYREWKVLIPATLIVVVDHALRGTFWPQSIFGVEWASQWRWLEHAGWVVFEDIFLIWGCIRASREMDMLALRQAELETTNERVEAEVTLKTARLESVTQELVATARRAGMAEIATGVLHNVGNVLNTVNVSASVATEAVRRSEVQSLIRAGDLLKKNQGNLGAYLTSDDHGKHLPGFFIELADCLGQEQGVVLGELANLAQGLEHIKKIISAQQRHAKRGTLRERILPAELFEQALAMDAQANAGTEIQIVRDYAAVGPAVLDKHKVLQILINLLSNARKAVDAGGGSQQRITLSIGPMEVNGEKGLFFAVMDNGVGIEPENLDKVFAHGFTTFKDGHGFGLHSAANEAKVMGGGLTVRSDGAGSGTTFTLELPLGSMTEAEIMMADKKGTTCNRP